MAPIDLSGVNGIKAAAGDRFEIHHINVGCGDCTLLLIKNGDAVVRSVLIDSGRTGGGLLAYLADKLGGYRTGAFGRLIIDCLVTSHYHIDHLGGLYDIADAVLIKSHVDVNYFWDNGQRRVPDANMSFPAGMDRAAEYNRNVIRLMFLSADSPYQYINYLRDLVIRDRAERIALTFNDLPHDIVLGTVGGRNILMTCVCGNGCVAGAGGARYGIVDKQNAFAFPNNLNDISLGFVIHDALDNFKYFTGGDLSGNDGDIAALSTTRNIETAVANAVGRVTAAKINHHGSRSSTNPAWLAQLNPDSMICFPFYMSQCNLPTAEVLFRILGKGITNLCFTGRPYYQNRFINYGQQRDVIAGEYVPLFQKFQTLWNLVNVFSNNRVPIMPDGKTLNVFGIGTQLNKAPYQALLDANIIESRRSLKFKNIRFFIQSAGEFGQVPLDGDVAEFVRKGTVSDSLRTAPSLFMAFKNDDEFESELSLHDIFYLAPGQWGPLVPEASKEYDMLAGLSGNMNRPDVLDEYVKCCENGQFASQQSLKAMLFRKVANYLALQQKEGIVAMVGRFTPAVAVGDPYYDNLRAVTLVYPDPNSAGRLFQTGDLGCYAIV